MKSTWLKVACLLLIISNTVDATLTCKMLSQGIGTELNPIMGYLVNENYLIFFIIKVIASILIALYLFESHKLASALILSIAFSIVCLWNMLWLTAL